MCALGSYGGEIGSLTFLVRSVWLGMRASIAESLTEFGLSTSQFATLMMVTKHPGMSVSEIAREVGSTRQAANEMLGGLEAEGLIERRPNPTDKRSHQIHLTDAGRQRFAAAQVSVARREAELEADLTPEQQAAVRSWMTGIAAACAGSEDRR